FQRGGRVPEGFAALHAQPVHDPGQPGNVADPAEQLGGGHQLARLDRAALLELGQQAGQVHPAQPGPERVGDGPAQQRAEDLFLPALLADLEFDLAAQRAHDGGQVAHPGDRRVARRLGERRPAYRGRRRALRRGDGEPGGDTGTRVYHGRLADGPGEPRDHLHQVLGKLGGGPDVGFLPDQGELVGQRQRVMGADLRAEPVLERRDDASPVGVVLRVRAGHEQHVERQPQGVAADADVALLEHVEQRHLDPLGQVGQLVQGKDATVGPGDQAEVNGLRVAQGASLGHLDRVDVADQVADAGVRGGELLAVPLVPVPPADGQFVTQLGGEAAAPRTGRLVRVVVDLAALDRGRPLVEQAAQGADQPGLTLAALAEQDDVVPGDQGALEVRQDGLAEPDDAGKGILPRPQHGEQVMPYLLLDTAVLVAAGAQLAEGDRGWGACVVMLAGLLHHSTVCRDRSCSHLRVPGTVAATRRGGVAHLRLVEITPGAVAPEDVTAARKLIADVISDTPLLHSRVLSEAVAGPVYLKCENLQRTGSFKVRGAYYRIARLAEAERARGVVAASAGNHSQGVAFAAGRLGCAATVFMPAGAPLPKVQATRGYGAEVILRGSSVEDAVAEALAFAERTGAVFIHPYDHQDIVAGQGTLGFEIIEQCPQVRTVVLPVGGGGLAAGVTVAIKSLDPEIQVIGVQAEAVAP